MNLNLSFKLHPVECRQYPGLSKLICLHPSNICWLTQLPYYLLTRHAAPLPRPRPVAVLEVWLTQGRSSVLSPVSSQEGGIFMFLCPGIDGSKLVNTHPQLKVRLQFSLHSPFHEQNGQMHVHLNCGIERCWQQPDADSRDSGIVFPISVDMTNVQTPALFWRWTTAIFVANNISHTLSRHEADAEDQTFLCPNIFLNDTETWPTLVSNTWYLWTIRSSESLWWVSRRMTKQTQALSCPGCWYQFMDVADCADWSHRPLPPASAASEPS